MKWPLRDVDDGPDEDEDKLKKFKGGFVGLSDEAD